MAESKRDTEESYDLPVPPFDAPAYVRKEAFAARATILLALYGLVLGIVGALVAFYLRNPVASLGIFFLGLTAMKGLLQSVGVDTDAWDRKTWAGNVGLVFFTWLAAWVVFTNRPFVA